MLCAICGAAVRSGEASVPTRDGAIAHVACADREAARTWARRQMWALAHLVIVAVAIGVLLWAGTPLWLVALIGIGVIMHPLVHRRWWRYRIRDVDSWLRRRGQP